MKTRSANWRTSQPCSAALRHTLAKSELWGIAVGIRQGKTYSAQTPLGSLAIYQLLEIGADTFPFGEESDEIVGACYCRGSSLFRLHGNRQGASQ